MDLLSITKNNESSTEDSSKEQSVFDSWVSPSSVGKYRTGLMLNNSLSGGKKVEFIPSNKGNRITWYGCGPTVYDASHMGHARTYVTFDIIRRVLTNYFGYQVFMCMNITDIDDKIIKRSLEEKNKSDNFLSLARYWEKMFWNDMTQLNVMLPDIVTRVSEYIPEIISFIQTIINNGYAYVSEESVYFDTQKFRESVVHVYGRMEPSSVNDAARVLEGEGELGIVEEKKCPLDFALWKKAKPEEPSWQSPWGHGRPGWHIECSTMAASVLGFPVDIHSGGIDLRFPHHDNELAQTEACFDRPQWVNYFLHSGHLHIKGSKMSKSLKNFITIQECLETYSARVIRMLLLLHKWDSPMNYSSDGQTTEEANEIDWMFVNFFCSVQAIMRNTVTSLSGTEASSDEYLLKTQKWDNEDQTLHETILNTEERVDSALKDNIDTMTAMNVLKNLVNVINNYLKRDSSKLPLVLKGAKFIFRILKIFGLTNGSESELNYITEASSTDKIENNQLMDCLSSFRGKVRLTSQSLLQDLKKSEGVRGNELKDKIISLLQLCDEIRDSSLPELGIILEDTATGHVWKKLTKDEIKRQQNRKQLDDQRKKTNKDMEQKSKKQYDHLPPERYYPELKSSEFLKFDENGVPLILADGTSVSKNARDKMKKFLEKQAEIHKLWKQTQSSN